MPLNAKDSTIGILNGFNHAVTATRTHLQPISNPVNTLMMR